MDLNKLKEAQDIVSEVISTIFLHEDDFKSKVLSHYLKPLNSLGEWSSDLYEIVSCHSAYNYRLSLSNYSSDHVLYVKSTDIFDWIEGLHKETLASWED